MVLHLGNTLDPIGGLGDLVGSAHWGIPGIGGSLRDGVVEFMCIAQQPTTLGRGGGRSVAEFEAALASHGFRVSRVDDIGGWLEYHSVFIAAVASALDRCAGDAEALSGDRAMLTLMCRAIEERLHASRARGLGGLPRNLRVLHFPLLRPFAVRYWARTMRSPIGERCYAAHSRHARAEMDALAQAVLTRLHGQPHLDHLQRLLNATGS